MMVVCCHVGHGTTPLNQILDLGGYNRDLVDLSGSDFFFFFFAFPSF